MTINRPNAEVLDPEKVSERSYGIIPLRLVSTSLPPEGQPHKVCTANTEVLLIKQKTVLKSQAPFWCFPKGHPERGDLSAIRAAIREVQEETGIVVKEESILFKDAEGLVERYVNPVTRRVKENRYWIGLVEGQRSQIFELQEAELEDARWLTWNEALGLMTFDEGKTLLERAMELLDEKEQI